MQFRVSEMTLTGIKFVQKYIVVLSIQQHKTRQLSLFMSTLPSPNVRAYIVIRPV